MIAGPTDRKDNPLLDLVHRSLVPSMVLIHAGSDEDSILRQSLAVLKDIPSDSGILSRLMKGFVPFVILQTYPLTVTPVTVTQY